MSLLAKFVDEDFGFIQSSDVWGRAVKHDSFVVDLIKNIWYWNSEDESGNTLDYLCKIRGMKRDDANKLIHSLTTPELILDTNVDIVVPHASLVDVLWKNGRHHKDYWKHRGLSDSTINRYRLGYYNHNYTVPIYNKEKLVNFQCRREMPEKRIFWWYAHTNVYNVLFQEFLLKYTDTIFIVEGLLDSLLLAQKGIPAVAPCGGNLGWRDVWFQKFIRAKEIYCVADNDNAGKIFLNKVAESLGKQRVKGFIFADEKKGFDTVDFFRDGGSAKSYLEVVTNRSDFVYKLS